MAKHRDSLEDVVIINWPLSNAGYTTMAKSRSYSVAGPSVWNRLPPSARPPMFLLPYHFLKPVYFLGAEKRLCWSAAVEGHYINT